MGIELTLRRQVIDLQRTLEAMTAERDEWKQKAEEIFFYHESFCERLKDGGFVKAKPANLQIVRDSQVK